MSDDSADKALTDGMEHPFGYGLNDLEHKSLYIQIGGDHYKKYKIQPMEFMHVNQIPPVEANICKYVLRHKDKNGKEDLLKARHLIDFLLEYDYEEK